MTVTARIPARAPATADPARVIAAARAWLGTPYCHQASCRGAGADCLGLVRGVWRDLFGPEPMTPPPYSRDWGEIGPAEPLLDAARATLIDRDPGGAEPGDVLLFRMRRGAVVKHCGILSAPGRFIHAYEATGVIEQALTAAWRRRLAFAFAFPAFPARGGG